jgi:ubiquinone/menaquinone biosynthesis C-methylase UbiE
MVRRRLLKIGFHLLYHQMAWSYDLVAWLVSLGQWAAWRRLALRFTQPGLVLELAHGTGGLFLDMVERGYQPVGIDLSPYMSRLARQRLRRRNLPAYLSRARAQQLPLQSGSFTNVIATFPTPYIFESETLAEIYRVLTPPDSLKGTPAGRLIIVMEGQVLGPQPIRGFIDWLYTITDQRDFSLSKPVADFKRHNFLAHWEVVDHEGVKAKLIIAEKVV